MAMAGNRKKILGIVLATVLLLTGCGGGSDAPASGGSGQAPAPPSDNLSAQETKVAGSSNTTVIQAPVSSGQEMNIDQLYTQVAIHVTDWEWPANYQPDLVESRAVDQAPPDSQFLAGHEQALLAVKNKCAWSLEWLDAYNAADSASESVALDHLQIIADSEQEQSSRSFLQSMIDGGRLGDPTIIQQYVDANECASKPWLSGVMPARSISLEDAQVDSVTPEDMRS